MESISKPLKKRCQKDNMFYYNPAHSNNKVKKNKYFCFSRRPGIPTSTPSHLISEDIILTNDAHGTSEGYKHPTICTIFFLLFLSTTSIFNSKCSFFFSFFFFFFFCYFFFNFSKHSKTCARMSRLRGVSLSSTAWEQWGLLLRLILSS